MWFVLPRSPALRQYVAGVISQLAVASVGSAYVWLEPLTLRMTEGGEGVPVSKEDMSWLVAIIEFGCIAAPLPAGYFAEWYGRKLTNLSVGPLCLLCWLLTYFTRNVPMLYVIRLLQGIATGIAFTINPIYTAETVDPAMRGAISGIFQVAFYAGCTYTYSLGPYMSYDWYAVAGMWLPLFFTIAAAFFPESPYWLLKTGKEEKAREALMWFRPGVDITKDFEEMKKAVSEDMASKSEKKPNAWKILFTDRYERKAFIIVQIVCFAKFVTGMPTIVAYASETFSKSDNFLSPAEMTIILGVMLTGIGVLSAVLSDRVGRKALLLISCFGCFVAHLFTGAYYYLHEKTDVDAGPLIWMMYLGLVLYCVFSDIGLGPLLQTLQAEMFGTATRELAGSITESFGAVLCFFVIKFYEPINSSVGVYANFWIYGMTGLVGGLLLWFLMVETAGKTIGRIEERTPKNDIETVRV